MHALGIMELEGYPYISIVHSDLPCVNFGPCMHAKQRSRNKKCASGNIIKVPFTSISDKNITFNLKILSFN